MEALPWITTCLVVLGSAGCIWQQGREIDRLVATTFQQGLRIKALETALVLGGPEPRAVVDEPVPVITTLRTDTAESATVIQAWAQSLPPVTEKPWVEESLARFRYNEGHRR